MQVREERVVGLEAGALGSEGLLDLHDHLGVGEHVVGGADDGRASLLVLDVAEAGAVAGRCLDVHVVAPVHELAHRCRGEAYPSFRCLDLCGDSDVHGSAPVSGRCAGRWVGGPIAALWARRPRGLNVRVGSRS